MNITKNFNSFHEADASSVNSEILAAAQSRKSNFEGSLFRHNDVWNIVRPCWILPPNVSESDDDARLFPGFVVERNGRQETFFLSTLIRPVTDFDGNELTLNGTANVEAANLFAAAQSDEEALNAIANAIHAIRVKRERRYTAYLRSTGKSRPNTLLLEFDIALSNSIIR